VASKQSVVKKEISSHSHKVLRQRHAEHSLLQSHTAVEAEIPTANVSETPTHAATFSLCGFVTFVIQT
jgi:hypothetical protein